MRRSLIIGLTVLSLMLCAGTTYSVEGPSATVVFPLICEVPTSSLGIVNPEHLDMVFTIANVTNFDMHVIAVVRNFKSVIELDFNVHLTPYDVSSNTCLGVINMMSPATKSNMVETINGTQYYVGYIRYDVEEPAAGALIGWGEMETLSSMIIPSKPPKISTHLFTDTGFNGVPDFYSLVNAATTVHDCPTCFWHIDSNQMLMPRYKIANNDPDTYNWWIIMTPSDAVDGLGTTCVRRLECITCDENENCASNAIPIPFQVNVINVANYVPANIFPLATFPKSGFAMCEVVLSGTSFNDQNPCGNAGNEQYLGWSYQHTLGSFNLETALIFPIHRQVGQIAVGPPGQ